MEQKQTVIKKFDTTIITCPKCQAKGIQTSWLMCNNGCGTFRCEKCKTFFYYLDKAGYGDLEDKCVEGHAEDCPDSGPGGFSKYIPYKQPEYYVMNGFCSFCGQSEILNKKEGLDRGVGWFSKCSHCKTEFYVKPL